MEICCTYMQIFGLSPLFTLAGGPQDINFIYFISVNCPRSIRILSAFYMGAREDPGK